MADCPQVQCVEQYIAQQADELSLEPTEIINVIRKTNEGKSIGWETFIFRKQAVAAETEIIIIINICYTEKVTCTNMTLYHLPGLCLFICLHPPTLALAVYLL